MHKKQNIFYQSYHHQITETGDEKTKIINKTPVFNDSECLAVDFALYITGKQRKMKSKGSIAFIAYVCDSNNKLEKVYFGRNWVGSLDFIFTNDYLIVASELDKTDNVKPNELYIFDPIENRLTHKPLELKNGYTSTYKATKTKQIGFSDGEGHYQRWDYLNEREDACETEYGTMPVVAKMNNTELATKNATVNARIYELEDKMDYGSEDPSIMYDRFNGETEYLYAVADEVQAEIILREEIRVERAKRKEIKCTT